MKRLIDLMICLMLFSLLLFPMVLIAVLIKLTSKGPILYWSKRVGIDGLIFYMPKFRTMRVNTPELATHLLSNPSNFLTPIGGFLRQNSLDEIPQLLSIFKGDMSLVGPRPALFNQEDLIELRRNNGLDKLTPGLTGWAQVNGRDELSIDEKIQMDLEYKNKKSFYFDSKILWLTFLKVLKRKGISH